MTDELKRMFKHLREKLNIVSTSKSDNNGQSPFDDLPDDVLENIFSHLPGAYVCNTISVVCKRWNDVVNTNHFWFQKALLDNKLTLNTMRIFKNNNIYESKRLYFKNPFNKNLLKNACGEDGFNNWYIDCFNSRFNSENHLVVDSVGNFTDLFDKYARIKNGASILKRLNGFEIESDEHGAKHIYDQNNNALKKFSTTYTYCFKMQMIDLFEVGFFKELTEQASLEVKDFYAARFDCASEYHLRVFLLDEDFDVVDKVKFDENLEQWGDGEWKEFKHLFNDFKGVRYVCFYHGGKDRQFWAGNYGVKISNSSVKLLLDI